MSQRAMSLNPFGDDPIKASLRSALRYTFERHGYGHEEAVKLAEIATEPVALALEVAQKAFEMHVEAIAMNPSTALMGKTSLIPEETNE